MKKSSLKAQREKRTHYDECQWALLCCWGKDAHLFIVKIHDATSTGRDILVALSLASHRQCRIHMHVMAGKIQRYESLEDDCQSGHSQCKKHKQARCGASISNHVQDSTKASRLSECSGCEAVKGIQEAAY